MGDEPDYNPDSNWTIEESNSLLESLADETVLYPARADSDTDQLCFPEFPEPPVDREPAAQNPSKPFEATPLNIQDNVTDSPSTGHEATGEASDFSGCSAKSPTKNEDSKPPAKEKKTKIIDGRYAIVGGNFKKTVAKQCLLDARRMFRMENPDNLRSRTTATEQYDDRHKSFQAAFKDEMGSSFSGGAEILVYRYTDGNKLLIDGSSDDVYDFKACPIGEARFQMALQKEAFIDFFTREDTKKKRNSKKNPTPTHTPAETILHFRNLISNIDAQALNPRQRTLLLTFTSDLDVYDSLVKDNHEQAHTELKEYHKIFKSKWALLNTCRETSPNQKSRSSVSRAGNEGGQDGGGRSGRKGGGQDGSGGGHGGSNDSEGNGPQDPHDSNGGPGGGSPTADDPAPPGDGGTAPTTRNHARQADAGVNDDKSRSSSWVYEDSESDESSDSTSWGSLDCDDVRGPIRQDLPVGEKPVPTTIFVQSAGSFSRQNDEISEESAHKKRQRNGTPPPAPQCRVYLGAPAKTDDTIDSKTHDVNNAFPPDEKRPRFGVHRPSAEVAKVTEPTQDTTPVLHASVRTADSYADKEKQRRPELTLTTETIRPKKKQRNKRNKVPTGPLDFIEGEPAVNDVRFGRGACNNYHPGNRQLRFLVHKHQPEYTNAKSVEAKRAVVHKVLAYIQRVNGRFVKQQTKGSRWHVVPFEDRLVYNKVSQSLRDYHKKFEAASIQYNSLGSIVTT